MHFHYVTRGTRLSQEGTILLWKLALSHRVSSNHAPKASRIRVREEMGQIMLGDATEIRLPGNRGKVPEIHDSVEL
jgi:hypothetical protein